MVGVGTGWREIKGRKKWDNLYSIINKTYFKKRKERGMNRRSTENFRAAKLLSMIK